MIESLLKQYPAVQLYLVCGPVIRDPCCSYIKYTADTATQRFGRKVHYVDMHPVITQGDWGCAGHPSVQLHRKMAQIMIEALNK